MQTNRNINAASKEVNSARPMRCYIDTIIRQVIDDLNDQKNSTDEAFRHRIEETKEAKMKLELQHSEVCLFTIAKLEDEVIEISEIIFHYFLYR